MVQEVLGYHMKEIINSVSVRMRVTLNVYSSIVNIDSKSFNE
jgi:hypothetical protein